MFSKVSQCQYKPCKNGATCIDLKDDFMCRCTTDYVGKICDRKLVFNVLIHCILFFINEINMSLTCICRQNSGRENKFPKKDPETLGHVPSTWIMLWIFTLKSKYHIKQIAKILVAMEFWICSFVFLLVYSESRSLWHRKRLATLWKQLL